MILGIDTSTPIAALGLYQRDGGPVADISYCLLRGHGRLVNKIIADIFDVLDQTPWVLQGIAVGTGPGSFTGTRIAITIAKTLSTVLAVPVWGLSSLANLAANCPSDEKVPTLALIDARNERAYWGLYSFTNYDLSLLEPEGVDDIDRLVEVIDKYPRLNLVGMMPETYYNKLQARSAIPLNIMAPPLNQIKGGIVAYRGHLVAEKNPGGDEIGKILPNYMKEFRG